MSNKRRHAQAFPLAATLIGVSVAVCIAVFAIKALTVKYQVIQGGEKLKQIERELVALRIKNEALQTQKDLLTSPPALAKALEQGFIKLKKIEEPSVLPVGRESKQVVAKLSEPGGTGR